MVPSSQTPVNSPQAAHFSALADEPTTLATVAKAIAETLQAQYAIDPDPILNSIGLPRERLHGAGARCPWRKMQRLWRAAVTASGDSSFGLCAGQHIRPTTFHAVGFSWLASQTLLEALQRLARYYQVISTVPVEMTVSQEGCDYVLTTTPIRHRVHEAAIDAMMIAIVRLCQLSTNVHFSPEQVELARHRPRDADEYYRAFAAPVRFAAGRNALHFRTTVLEATLPGENQELARANDEIAERYIARLNPNRVSSQVRKLLIDLLPTGDASARTIAMRLNKSVSSLQRQLQTEHTTFKDIAEDTKRALAEQYVGQGQLSLSQIAYLMGFSDQSNFSRAFKRWTGAAPREYRARVDPNRQ